MKTHDNANCGMCGKRIKRHGLAMISHIRTHVRDGRLIEQPPWQGGSPMFKSGVFVDDRVPCSQYF